MWHFDTLNEVSLFSLNQTSSEVTIIIIYDGVQLKTLFVGRKFIDDLRCHTLIIIMKAWKVACFRV
jgi:hypothetical protein